MYRYPVLVSVVAFNVLARQAPVQASPLPIDPLQEPAPPPAAPPSPPAAPPSLPPAPPAPQPSPPAAPPATPPPPPAAPPSLPPASSPQAPTPEPPLAPAAPPPQAPGGPPQAPAAAPSQPQEAPTSPLPAASPAGPSTPAAPASPSAPAVDVAFGDSDGVRPRPGSLPAKIWIELTFDHQWDTSVAHDFFAKQDTTLRVGLDASYELFELAESWVLAAQLGWNGDSLAEDRAPYGNALQSMKLTSDSFYGGAILRHHTLSWLTPQARVAAGVSLLSMEVAAGGEEPFTDSGTAFYSTLGAGFVAHTPTGLLRHTNLSGGLVVEGGFSYESSNEMALFIEDEETRTPVEDAGLGTLNRSGPYLRIAVLGRF